MAARAMLEPEHRRIALARGVLDLTIDRADWPLDDLCAFAERENPRRGFLIVSKVLGRHVPARPSVMRASARALASRIDPALPGPVLVMGLAETAICLGQSVVEEIARARDDVAFLPSTRMVIDAEVLTRFEEPHSHASAHLVYRPEGVAIDAVRSLVIVDDEISTGRTILNLIEAMAPHLPLLEHTLAVALTDWSGGAVDAVSLLSGTLRWTRDPGTPLPQAAAFSAAAPALGALDQRRDFGRLGGRGDLIDYVAMVARLDLPSGSRVRVLGTGEFTYAPFRLGEALEAMGHDVVMQSTTRSPAKLGGAMARMLRFADNYGTVVPNFLYNADPADGRLTIVAHETPVGSIDPVLIDAFGARTFDMAAS